MEQEAESIIYYMYIIELFSKYFRIQAPLLQFT